MRISKPCPLSGIASAITTVFVIASSACQTVTFEDDEGSTSSADATEDSSSEDSSSSGGTAEPIYNCDPGDDPACPEGQKCTVLEGGGPPIYDCVNDDGAKLPFEACTPNPSTGQDLCPAGFACIPSEAGGADGQCLELCLQDGDCELALCTAQPGQQVPICAPICDPLSPFCPEQQKCQRVRKTAFVCRFPGPNDVGTNADFCDIVSDSGCAQGFVCETGQIVQDCIEQSCCTALCDLSGPDPCVAPMSCGDLPLDPQPGLENVGACYIPQ